MVCVPEGKYRLYKACGDENTLLMEKLLLTKQQMTDKEEMEVWEKIGWTLLGAGIYSLIHEATTHP